MLSISPNTLAALRENGTIRFSKVGGLMYYRHADVELLMKGLRSGASVLESYLQMLDKSKKLACITLAFGINKLFKQAVIDNDKSSAITFFLLEKKDAPTKKNKDTFVKIGAKQNVYQAFGNYLKDNLYQWAKEISHQQLRVNKHVSYTHSRFLLMDPLGQDPIVVSGPANFSAASTNSNDENILLIRGDYW